MEGLFWGIIIIGFVLSVGFFIYVMVEAKAALRSFREFLQTMGDSVRPAMDELQKTLNTVRNSTENLNDVADELQKTLGGMRNVTDNVTTVTRDITVLSGSVREVGENIKHVSGLIDDLTTSTAGKASGIKAGVRAATDVLVRSFIARRKI